MDKLNPRSPKGKKIVYHGKVIEQYWEDISLLAKYLNGTEFINEISRRYRGFLSTRNLLGYSDTVTRGVVNEKEDGFKAWLRSELAHEELRAYYQNSNDSTIREIKKWLPSGP